MSHPIRVAVYISRSGPDPDRQQAAIMTLCEHQGWHPAVICWTPADAERCLSSREVELIVAMIPDPDLAHLGDAVRTVRPAPTAPSLRHPDLADLLRRWASQGRQVEEMADLLGDTTGAIRRALVAEQILRRT